ncbi:DNA-directed RNA polymerase III subunit RPC7-like [Impatiens glandulifera]|uniref:DNA-directed RNA polymerase III subunit RPC7-like n=1 Tax=Impatiens glandulifera TaxID=253017 RepID=UPI001FB15017|nr:DNA-directed RNA polymerase III subunit RPC7-like [Impatiens glandulifera]
MSFRGGGGRGGGRFGRGNFGRAANKPFVYFPPEIELPEIKTVAKEEIDLIAFGSRLQNFWASSPYNLSEEGPRKEENVNEEMFSDKKKQMNVHKRKLLDYIMCGIENVPAELAEGTSKSGSRKKVQWSQGSEWKKLDMFEKLEQKRQAGGGDGEEEEEEEEVAEEDEEFSDDGDYNQNIDFDDDEDDLNMEDDGNDEPTY